MKWHPVVTGQEYPVSQIIEVLHKDIESGRLGFVNEKIQALELYEPHRSEHAIGGFAFSTLPHPPHRKAGDRGGSMVWARQL